MRTNKVRIRSQRWPEKDKSYPILFVWIKKKKTMKCKAKRAWHHLTSSIVQCLCVYVVVPTFSCLVLLTSNNCLLNMVINDSILKNIHVFFNLNRYIHIPNLWLLSLSTCTPLLNILNSFIMNNVDFTGLNFLCTSVCVFQNLIIHIKSPSLALEVSENIHNHKFPPWRSNLHKLKILRYDNITQLPKTQLQRARETQ